MNEQRERVERAIGAVIVPEVRVGGTIAGPKPIVPSSEYLLRYPPRGVIVFGRTPEGASDPSALVASVRRELAAAGFDEPFAACDLEQGAGLHFPDATRLPPALALAANPHAKSIGVAGELTAAEARARGVELVLAPVVDVNTRRDNPIIAVRSFGDDADSVARRASEFVDGLHRGGAGACAKHFPGHGDTDQDSHRELARIARDAAGFRAIDFVPFRALVERELDSVMVAHVDAPPLTGEDGLPATLSRRVIVELLRGELGFDGAVLSDAMNMHALRKFEHIHVRALAAGCDGLVCPADPMRAAEELSAAVERGELSLARLFDAAERMTRLCERVRARRAAAVPIRRARIAADLAGEALVASGGRWPWKLGEACEILAPVPSGAGPEARAAIHALRRRTVDPSGTRNALIPVLAEVRAFDGRYGIGGEELAALEAKLEDLERLGWKTAIAWFASPQSLPESWWKQGSRSIVIAFAPTPPMVEAVADFLAGDRRAVGSLPTRLG